MVRENSIIAIGAHDDKPDYDYADSCELRVYTLLDGVKAETTVYGMSNLPELTVSAARSGHTIPCNSRRLQALHNPHGKYACCRSSKWLRCHRRQ